jgi:hypothetical protein
VSSSLGATGLRGLPLADRLALAAAGLAGSA